MSKKIINATEEPMMMFGHMGGLDAAASQLATKTWNDYFSSVIDENGDKAYDSVVLVRNTNICAYSSGFNYPAEAQDAVLKVATLSNNAYVKPGTLIQSLPIFHAAVVLLEGEKVAWVYLFQRDKSMTKMLAQHPFLNIKTKNGKSLKELVDASEVSWSIYDERKTPLYPPAWESPHQYDGTVFASTPCWPSRELYNRHLQHMEAASRQFTSVLESVPEHLRKCITEHMFELQSYYSIPLPQHEIRVSHVSALTEVYGRGSGHFTLIQHNKIRDRTEKTDSKNS